MDWINQGNFEFRKTPKRKYVYRKRNNGSKQMINVPKNVNTKTAAKNWLKKHYKSPNKRVPIFTTSAVNLRAAIKTPNKGSTPNTIKFNCKIGNHLYHRVAINGSVGFRRLNTKNTLNLFPLRKTVIRKGMIKLDAGKQGVVFLASARKSVPQGSEFVIKICPTDNNVSKNRQISRIEYMVQKALYKVVPANIPRPIAPLIECNNFLTPSNLRSKSAVINDEKNYSKQTLMFSEYISYGPLYEYLTKLINSKKKLVNDQLLRSIIFQVLMTIRKIRKVYPGFRHNDLHLDNILVKPGKPYPVMVLNDFGFSILNQNSKNPLVFGKNFINNWGIGPNTSSDYDVHMFLNGLRKWCETYKNNAPDRLRVTLLFLNNKIPLGYRQEFDKYTTHSRLKYLKRYPGLPSLNQILNSKYFVTNKRLTPTATPTRNLKLSMNTRALNNLNLKYNQGRAIRRNTPAPVVKITPGVNLTGLKKTRR
jgi:hypothetical protein